MLSNYFFNLPPSPQNSHANKTFMWSIYLCVCLRVWVCVCICGARVHDRPTPPL